MRILSEENKENETKKVLLKDLDHEFDFNEILCNHIVEKNIDVLLGHAGGYGIGGEINRYLIEKIDNRNAVLISAFTDRLNDLISDEMIFDVRETVALYNQKIKLEHEIAILRSSKLEVIGSSIDSEMRRLSIDTSIDTKENELKECTNAYIIAYLKSYKSSLISHELSDLYNQIYEIQYEQVAEISEEIDLLNAKIGALKRMVARLNLKDEISTVINEKMNMRIAEAAINCAALHIPLVKSLVK